MGDIYSWGILHRWGIQTLQEGGRRSKEGGGGQIKKGWGEGHTPLHTMKELDRYFVTREDIKMTGESKPSLEGEEIRLIFLLYLMLQAQLLVQSKIPRQLR